MKYFYILFILILILASVFLTRFLMKKYRLNRWIIGGTAPLVLIIPSILFNNINSIIWNALLVVFAVMCIIFFEITRMQLENNQLKGVINYKKSKK